MGEDVLPEPQPSSLLRLQGSSRLAFGATTAALVTLTTGSTALLVESGSDVVATDLPGTPAAVLGRDAVVDRAPVVVDAPVGASLRAAVARPSSEEALARALGTTDASAPRRLTTRLVPAVVTRPVLGPEVTPALPVVVPPTVPVVPATPGLPTPTGPVRGGSTGTPVSEVVDPTVAKEQRKAAKQAAKADRKPAKAHKHSR